MPVRRISYIALVVAHVAGMIDLVALPVWVSTLIEKFHYDAEHAGMLATTYLVFAVLCSVCLAPAFARLPKRVASASGFALAACGFWAGAHAGTFPLMLASHAVAGLGVGCGLSIAHGTIGQTTNPHRLFAAGHLALAIFGIAYFAAVPSLVDTQGGPALFYVFAGVAGVAAIALALGYPATNQATGHALPSSEQPPLRRQRLPRGCWTAIAGIVLMALNQAMVFSFVQQIGLTRGFGSASVNAVLVAVGLVNLLPPIFAALLQRRLDARNVALAGPVAQAVLALTIANTSSFAAYAVCTSLWVFAMIFTHTFLFGLLSTLDASGRAVAYTPAMLMAGSAVGPILGGTLIVHAGFSAIGIAVVFISIGSILFFGRLRAIRMQDLPLELPAVQ